MNAAEVLPLKPWAKVEAYIPAGFILNDDGVYLDGNTPKKIAGRCWISALTRSTRGEGWGYLINWIDQDGKHQQRAFPAQLLTARSAPLADDLQALGLQVIPGEQRHLMRYFGSFQLPNNFRLTSATRLGWLDDHDEDLVYVFPNRTLSAVPTNDITFQPDVRCPTAHTLRSQGTLDQWKNHVAAPCAGHPLAVFALCAGLSGPLLKLVGLDSGGFHFFGGSSKGKTTLMQVTASLWGHGADPAASGQSYISRWNTTGNALEAVAVGHNDGLLLLDEMGTCEAKNFGKVIYDLFGGRGKNRMDKAIQLRQPHEWRITALSTGEISVEEKIQDESKRAPLTGQRIRLLDIPIEDGVFLAGHGLDLGDFADRLKQAATHYFGTAAPAFIERLVGLEVTTAGLQQRIKAAMRAWGEDLKGNAPLLSYQGRVLQRFALIGVAGSLAVELGVLPFSDADVAIAVQDVWRRWLGDCANQPDTVRALRNLQRFILQFKAGRFRDVDDEQNGGVIVRDLAGYYDSAADHFLFTEAGFREACGIQDWRGVLRELAGRGFLFMNDGQKKKSKHTVAGFASRISLYAVRGSLLDEDF